MNERIYLVEVVDILNLAAKLDAVKDKRKLANLLKPKNLVRRNVIHLLIDS